MGLVYIKAGKEVAETPDNWVNTTDQVRMDMAASKCGLKDSEWKYVAIRHGGKLLGGYYTVVANRQGLNGYVHLSRNDLTEIAQFNYN